MGGMDAPLPGGKRAATSAQPANDAGAFDAAPATALSSDEERLLDAAMRASIPALRGAIARAITEARPRAPASPRLGARPGDLDAPVDDVTRARARALLRRHRGGQR